MRSKIINSLVNLNRSELIGLFAEEHISELESHITSLKEEQPEDKIIALLWCYVQTESQSIPTSFIAGTISEKLSDNNLIQEAPELSSLVYIKVAEALQNEGEHRLCLLLLDSIYKHIKSINADKAEEIKELLNKSIKVELIEAKKRKEDHNYLSYVQTLKENLNTLSQSDSKPSQENWKLDSSILEPETELSEPLSSLMEMDTQDASPLKTKVQVLTPLKILIFLAFILLLGFIKMNHLIFNDLNKKISSFWNSHTIGTLYSLNTENQEIKPYLPPLPPYSSIEKDTHLDSISERLSNIQITDKALNNQTPSPTQAISPNIDKEEIESLNVIPESAENIPIKKIPTSSVSSIPSPIDLGSSNKGAPVQESSPTMKADGKLYGSVATVDPVAGKAERALDGSPLKSYEVEKFDPPELYRTITGTNVLSAPSLMSESIGRLDAGTTVRVTAIMGQWSEIRSNAGRLGYIFLKDLKKEEESLD